MRSIDQAGIEKRQRIAAAKAMDPDLTYAQLQTPFGAGPRVVADALKRSPAEWGAMLGRVMRGSKHQTWKYLVVKVLRKKNTSDTAAAVKQRAEHEKEWRDVTGGTMQDVLDEHGRAGWELVASMLVGQDPDGGKWVYELHFKRPE